METSLQTNLPAFEKQRIQVHQIELASPESPLEPAMINQAKNNAAKAFNIQTETTAFESSDVRLVGMDEYKQAAQCLAEAFADDEVAQYFTHTPDRKHWDDARKWDLHVSILEYIVYAHVLKGLVLTSGPSYGCVALWYVDSLTIVSSQN